MGGKVYRMKRTVFKELPTRLEERFDRRAAAALKDKEYARGVRRKVKGMKRIRNGEVFRHRAESAAHSVKAADDGKKQGVGLRRTVDAKGRLWIVDGAVPA